ncbi:MAG: type III-A CRISPR-associated protein Cas10/Csm1 [Candidatus Nitrosocaldus sp.]
MHNEEDRIVVALAALLHDIGKFQQRGNRPRIKHQELSSQFVLEHLPDFGNGIREKVSRIVREHHNHTTDDVLTKIVIKADGLSASERLRSNEIYEDQGDYTAPMKYHDLHRRLSSVFNHDYYYPLNPITLDNIPEPTKVQDVTKQEYDEAWRAFINDVCRLIFIKDPYKYLESLLHIMKKHLFFIPSAPAFEEVPTISLYEHLRMTMAIALCLYDYCYINNNLNSKRLEEPKKLMIVRGDIGGIQRFIYTITPKGAAKALRARSFFISMICDAIARYIVDRLRLSSANIIFSGGGQFEILAPSTVSIKDIESDIMEFLLNRFNGRLYITISATEIEDSELERVDGGKFASRLLNAIEEKKRTPIPPELCEQLERIFGPLDRKDNICHACNEETDEKADEEGVIKCRICNDIEGIAKPLASANYLIEIRTNSRYDWRDERFYSINFTDRLGLCYVLVKNDDALRDVLQSVSKEDILTIYSINRMDIGQSINTLSIADESNVILGFKLIANVTPMRDGDIKTFDEIANESKGDKLLGIIRMDVDNLGEFFGRTTTLSEYSTKSALLSLFFDGFINTICRNYKDIYTIYSGGDDLFIISPWNTALDLVKQINEEFRKYTSSSLTISAGVLFTDPRLPVHIFAETVKNMLDKAKYSNNGRKNRICVFEYPLTWDTFNELFNIYKRVEKIVDEDRISRASITKMIYAWTASKVNGESISVLRYKLKYIIGKTISTINDENVKGIIIEEVDKKGLGNFINYISIPLKWVELATREEVDGRWHSSLR